MSTSSSDVILSRAPDGVKNAFASYIGPQAFTIIVALLLVVVWLWLTRSSEHNTMPTSTMYAQNQDSVNVGGSGGGAFPLIQAAISDNAARLGQIEGLEGGNPAVVTSTLDPASALMPGSPSWQVLNSPAYNCSGRDLTASADYRAYQLANMNAVENAVGGRGLDDGTARQILQGM